MLHINMNVAYSSGVSVLKNNTEELDGAEKNCKNNSRAEENGLQ